MAGEHLLNLDILAQENVEYYSLLRFEGREAISETFDHHLEVIALAPPADLSAWIGQLVEWTVALTNGETRTFAGRIYETRFHAGGGPASGTPGYHIQLRVRPAYHATAYARATHFIQDMDAGAIFDAVTADVPGLVVDKGLSGTPPKRGYVTRYDETEYDFLSRLLAQDAIFYYFTWDKGAGPFHHKMHLGNSASAYVDVPGGDEATFRPGTDGSTLKTLAHTRRAWPGQSDVHAFDVNKLDTPWTANAPGASAWGKIYTHSYEHMAGEAAVQGDVTGRATAHAGAYGQEAETISGTSDNPAFFAGGRIMTEWEGGGTAKDVVLTSVTHSAYDPWMLGEAGQALYRNDFTAMDAKLPFRPPVPLTRRRAPGPVLGVVKAEGAAEGEAKIDDQSRIPVSIVSARDYAGKLPKIVWLPVQQQWAAGTHGAQFFPRIGSRVVIDFLYGDPDLPFVSGTMYNPAQKYPFDPAAKATQTGWRSVTDKNGGIVQEFLFEDKPGAEEIQLTTDRDYRRMIRNDDWGTIKHDQTLIVENDQTETVKHDQKLNVENDRTVKITGVQDTAIQKTRTVKVTQKSLLESMKEIELKVGPSSIKMTMDKIVITSPQIEIKGTATVKVEAGAMLETKAPMAQHNADAMMIIKGGVVMIN
ncbi:type VI secretion system Vgr family protein [Sphingomonas profundi]|uniref:type VI secretion system Vgr family protein n=1 Tax=Alterirhizorhabdus profundi TaxID=2681549 RepID=UPI0012E71A5F|nr:type VI secretion system tip protein TssI/VgrG [Sphingomonas profundi]